MRRARLTYPGAFHHVMNRGIRGEYIFPDDGDKQTFLEILSEKAKLLGVHLIGYCVMNNHYHVLLENSSGCMSALLKQVNGSYGIYYRRKHGGKGYVFQNRFRSTLIQDDSYLRLAILYLLQNPVRAGLAANCIEYPWSSAGEYLGKARQVITDVLFVHGLWGGKKFMIKEIMGAQPDKLPIKKSDFGDLLGEYEFLTKALEKRDKRVNEKSLEKRREDDSWFEPVEKVYWELEKEHGIKFAELDFGTMASKKWRGELLVRLKELSGLTYREIAQLPEFRDIKLHSLAKLYKDARKRIAAKKC
jgi:REP element-mobilizing transposase RayT